jgi:hypothetical protein
VAIKLPQSSFVKEVCRPSLTHDPRAIAASKVPISVE